MYLVREEPAGRNKDACPDEWERKKEGMRGTPAHFGNLLAKAEGSSGLKGGEMFGGGTFES